LKPSFGNGECMLGIPICGWTGAGCTATTCKRMPKKKKKKKPKAGAQKPPPRY
jgi:hypothetical protein